MNDKIRVGVIGLGIMGGSFARNILEAGFSVCGHDIVSDNLKTLVQQGGIAANSACDVATQSDVIVTSLPSVSAFHEVMTGRLGIKSAAKKNLIVIECSTLSIEDKQTAHDALQSVGSILLDCPISGTGSQAKNKDLSVYVSGDSAASEYCQDVLDGMANHTFYVGEFGNGSKMKFVANVLVHIHNIASAEAFVLGLKAGLDPETIYKVVKAGAGNSRIFELRVPMMIDDDYSAATMKMDVWQKDVEIIDEFASALDCPMPLFNAGKSVYTDAMQMGMSSLDTASVCRVLEMAAKLDRS